MKRGPAPAPAARVRIVNDRPAETGRGPVVYWMTAARRTSHNWGLQHAAAKATELDRPLIILEALRCDYPYASDRFHAFVASGMRDNRAALRSRPATYHAYIEGRRGAGKGLLAALAKDAALVVGDDYPGFFLPRMVAAAARLPVRMELVDGNGLLPLSSTEAVPKTAMAFRRILQKQLPEHLSFPDADPLADADLPTLDDLPGDVATHWPTDGELLAGRFADLAIDHDVPPASRSGGPAAGATRLRAFLKDDLDDYHEAARHPDRNGTSHLSGYLHFGHVGAHQIAAAVLGREKWNPSKVRERPDGRRGWWGVGEGAEAFLEQLVTWRELAFHDARHNPGNERYETLPEWARATLEAHAQDQRHVYDEEDLEQARTDDDLWNAAQRQLVRDGELHNYLRMLWGKRVLEWTPHPRDAWRILLRLNDRWALDGRDPNSVAGIAWVFGRFDRPWQEREVFGKVRCMRSPNTRKKVECERYLLKYRAPRGTRPSPAG